MPPGHGGTRQPEILAEGHFPAEAEEVLSRSSQLGSTCQILWAASVCCPLPVPVRQEAWTNVEVAPEARAAPEQRGWGWMSTSGGSGALSHESCCPHPMVAVSLLGLGGGAPLAERRRPLTGRTRMLATKTRQ